MRITIAILSVMVWASLAKASEALSSERLYVLAINGGGDRQSNSASHLSHLRQLSALLDRADVPRDHVTILASDGSDPTPDLAVADAEPEGMWLLEGTELGRLLRHATDFENSVLPGYSLRPATCRELRLTFASLRGRMRAGDTLLIFVTDHGTMNERDPLENRISHESPIGKAMLGKHVGDTFEADTPNGRFVFTILKVE